MCENYKHKMVGKYPISYCSKYNNACTVEVERPCQLHTEIMELKMRIKELENEGRWNE